MRVAGLGGAVAVDGAEEGGGWTVTLFAVEMAGVPLVVVGGVCLASRSGAVMASFVLRNHLAEVGEVVADDPPAGGCCRCGHPLPASERASRAGAGVLCGGDRR